MKIGLAAMVVAASRLARIPRGTRGIVLVVTADEEPGCLGAQRLVNRGDVLGSAGAVVVCEPTSNYPMVGHRGMLRLDIRTTGVAAHASMPDEGVNAICKAARIVNALENYAFKATPHPVPGKPTLSVGTIRGGVNANSVPDRAAIGVDIRTLPEQSNESVYRDVKSLVGKKAEVREMEDLEGVWTNPNHEWIQQIYDIVGPILGE